MNIGAAAQLSGVPAKTIRYYEEVGVIRAAERSTSGYRTYAQTDIQILRFIQRARNLGFSVKDVSRLLGLWSDKNRARKDVKLLTQVHVQAIDNKIRDLNEMRDTLQTLIERCDGGNRPDCPILANLADADEHS